MIDTPPMGSTPVARLRRTISETQGKAIDILRQLKASTHPPPLLPPHEEEEKSDTIPAPPLKDDES